MDKALRYYQAFSRLHHHGPRLTTVNAGDVAGNGPQRANPAQQDAFEGPLNGRFAGECVVSRRETLRGHTKIGVVHYDRVTIGAVSDGDTTITRHTVERWRYALLQPHKNDTGDPPEGESPESTRRYIFDSSLASYSSEG